MVISSHDGLLIHTIYCVWNHCKSIGSDLESATSETLKNPHKVIIIIIITLYLYRSPDSAYKSCYPLGSVKVKVKSKIYTSSKKFTYFY